jgi:predicted Zn-dependent protease
VTVRNVAKRIIRIVDKQQGGGAQGHLSGLDWEIVVVDSPEVNAFVVPGGKIVVFTGARQQV